MKPVSTATMAKVLIVEDDAETAELVKDWLTSMEHHRVEVVNNGSEALTAVKMFQYDVMVLDRQLPGASGMDICRAFRQNGGQTPILMLTAKDSIEDKESAFDLGVDDYLTKPFHLKELAARIRALLKRPPISGAVLEVDGLTLETKSFSVIRDGKEIKLMPKEFALLEFLMRHKGAVFSVDDLLNRVWESDSESGPEALRQCIKRLREKIDVPGQSSMIQNIPRRGYTIKEFSQ